MAIRTRQRKVKGKGHHYTFVPEFHVDEARKACTFFSATHRELARLFDVNKDTITKWQHKYPDFAKAIQEGRDEYDSKNVEKALKKAALGYEYTEVKTEDVTIRRGRGDNVVELPATKVTRTTHIIHPNVTACIFWLVNRSRHSGRWINLYNVQVTGQDGGPLKMINENTTQEEASQIYMNLLTAVKSDLTKSKKEAKKI